MLDQNEVNTGRQFEIDLAKAFAVLFMIAIHVCEQMTDMEGTVLRHVKDKTAFYGAVGVTGAATLYAATVGCISEGITVSDLYTTTNYYGQTFLTTVRCMSVVMVCLSIYYALSLQIKGNEKVVGAIKYISTNVNTIYILQWLLICYTITAIEVLGLSQMSTAAGLLVSVIIGLVCLALTYVWNRFKR